MQVPLMMSVDSAAMVVSNASVDIQVNAIAAPTIRLLFNFVCKRTTVDSRQANNYTVSQKRVPP